MPAAIGQESIVFFMSEEKSEKRILMISFTAGLIMAIIELIFAVYSHSQSAMMDGVYDCTELIFIALILFMTPLFYKPISEKRPYGFFQIESIFLLIKGFMMLSVTVSVSMDVIESALNGGNPVDSVEVSLFQLALGVTSIFIYLWMKRLNRDLSSPTIDAELMGWRLDIFYSLGMAAAFFASSWLDSTKLAFIGPYFDQIVAVLIVVFMLPENIKMLGGAVRDIFLFPPEEETMERIKEICETSFSKYDFESLFYDVTRTGRHLWVSVYFTIQEETLSLEELRDATEQIDCALGEEFENYSFELIPMAPEMPVPDTAEALELADQEEAFE